jgi:hypothetical protein
MKVFIFIISQFLLLFEKIARSYELKVCVKPASILFLNISCHNWLVLGSEPPNILCFILFRIKRLRETTGDFRKKLETLGISWKSSIWIFPATTGSFWVQSLQKFFVLFYLRLRDFERLQETFEKKIETLSISWKSSVCKFPGTTGSFWV